MTYLNDTILDNGLSVLTAAADRFDICSEEPATFAAATGASSLGYKLTPTIDDPEARTPSGRRVVVQQITNGEVTVTGTATHWALTDTAGSRLLVTGPLLSGQVTTTGNTFTVASFSIGIPGPVA